MEDNGVQRQPSQLMSLEKLLQILKKSSQEKPTNSSQVLLTPKRLLKIFSIKNQQEDTHAKMTQKPPHSLLDVKNIFVRYRTIIPKKLRPIIFPIQHSTPNSTHLLTNSSGRQRFLPFHRHLGLHLHLPALHKLLPVTHETLQNRVSERFVCHREEFVERRKVKVTGRSLCHREEFVERTQPPTALTS